MHGMSPVTCLIVPMKCGNTCDMHGSTCNMRGTLPVTCAMVQTPCGSTCDTHGGTCNMHCRTCIMRGDTCDMHRGMSQSAQGHTLGYSAPSKVTDAACPEDIGWQLTSIATVTTVACALCWCLCYANHDM